MVCHQLTQAEYDQDVYTPVKNNQSKQSICDAFNAKYETQRGVKMSIGHYTTRGYKGRTAITEGIKLTVKNPGVPLPNIELFTQVEQFYKEVYAIYEEVSSAAYQQKIAPAGGKTPDTTTTSGGQTPDATTTYPHDETTVPFAA